MAKVSPVKRGALVRGKWVEGAQITDPTTFPNTFIAGHAHHLYVSWNCPYALSALLARNLKNLDGPIPVSFVESIMGDEGWEFSDKNPDPHHKDFKRLHQVYTGSVPEYHGRVTVPVLYDVTSGQIASNESADICRIFDNLGEGLKLYPTELEASQDWKDLHAVIHSKIFGFFYRVLIAKSEEEQNNVKEEIGTILRSFEERLATRRYLFGDAVTFLDLRLFVNLVLLDIAFAVLFKINFNAKSFPNLFGYVRDIYQLPKVSAIVNPKEIQDSAWYNLGYWNPEAQKPEFPNYSEPHNRQNIGV
jgi:putative glutathione S-transferase